MSRDLLQPHTVRIFFPTVDLQWQRATLSEQLVDDPFKDYRSAERPLPANAGHEFVDSGEKSDPINDEPATLVVYLRAFLREKPSGGPSPTVKRTSPDTENHEPNGYAKVYDDNNIFITSVDNDNSDTTYNNMRNM